MVLTMTEYMSVIDTIGGIIGDLFTMTDETILFNTPTTITLLDFFIIFIVLEESISFIEGIVYD